MSDEQQPTDQNPENVTPPEETAEQNSNESESGEKVQKPIAYFAHGGDPEEPELTSEKPTEESQGAKEEKQELTPNIEMYFKKERRPQVETPVQSLSDKDMERMESGPSVKDITDEDIEAELAAAMEGFSGEELLAPQSREEMQQPGSKKGKVISVHSPDVFVDIPGGRSQGVLPIQQFPDGPPEIGSEVDIAIEGYDNANGLLMCRRRGAAVVVDWSSVEVGQTVEARVTETNKGGLTVEVNGIRGFMPISQIDMYRVENAEQFINQRLLCLVTEANQENRNLVVSRRALLEREREEEEKKFWEEIAEGQVREGIVRSLRDFGAFVDLGGADGLLHISEISWQRVNDLSKVLQEGQRIQVAVIKVDKEHRKIGLGLRQLTPSPWQGIEDKYPLGSIVKGVVTRTEDFGAFVELEPGIEGLIHVSELAPQRVRRVTDIVQRDQEVQVMIMRVEPDAKRIGLSLKAATIEKPVEEEAEEEEVEVPKKKPRPRNYELKGGVGQKITFDLPSGGGEQQQ